MKLRSFATATALAALIVLPAAAQMPQPKPMQPVRPPVTAAPSTTPSTAPSTAPASSALVDINTASSADLDALPGIGKSRAAGIIKNRPYKAKDELVGRHIIPSNIYNAIKDKIIARQTTS